MTIVNCGWIVIAGYWAISAMFVKRKSRGPNWRGEILFRLIIAILVIALMPMIRGGRLVRHGAAGALLFSGAGVYVLGMVLFLAGLCIAVWARINLGRNWGMPMSMRMGHQLVTSGPYRYVRHPIYTGFLLAILGSALAGEFWWLAVFPVSLVYFVYSAVVEEKSMAEQFPLEYSEYKKRTKMLIPLIY